MKIMAKVYPALLALLMVVAVASCNCPTMRNLGGCHYEFTCRKEIGNITLPNYCQGSTNYIVSVDLTLTEVTENFDFKDVDPEFLTVITSLRVFGCLPTANLTILEYMLRLEHLYLVGSSINDILGNPFFRLNRLTTIDLSENRIKDVKDLFQFENSPNKMRKLSLAHNDIDEIPGDAFSELSSLVELDLSYNSISDLTEEPFNNLTTLETLKLNNNKIKDLNGAVNNLQNLKHLFLSGNYIRSIDSPSLKIIYELETFDISQNQLEELTSVIFSRHWSHFRSNSICKIKISGNHITLLPNGTIEILHRHTMSQKTTLNTMDVLTELDLSHNIISHIEYDAFKPVVRLSHLDLSDNRLSNLYINPIDLIHVQYLNLSYNYIQILYPDSFMYMKNLQNLDLSHNKLENIPDRTFVRNNYLTYVNMSHNEMSLLENLRIRMFHPDGGVLDLSNNGLCKLYMPSGEGLHLNMLLLNENNITDASLIDLRNQNDLKSIDMSNNSIKELHEYSLNLPGSLTFLCISFNFIEKISPGSFRLLGHLKTLRLGHNKITEIEYGSFQGLTSLMYLDLSFNNIHHLDSKVLIDLKSLTILSLRYNGLYVMDYNSWLGHEFNLKVYLEGNSFTCEWLGNALKDFNNGYSKMRPTVLMMSRSGHSIEGIPCVKKGTETGALIDTSPQSSVLADERLLVLVQKILVSVRDQNSFMKKFLRVSQENEANMLSRS